MTIPIAVKLSGAGTDPSGQLAKWRAFTGIDPVHLLTFGSQQGWSNASSEFIWASGLTAHLKAGVPVVASIPMCPDLPGAIDEVIAGKRDNEFIKAAKVMAGKIHWLRLGWECNGQGFGWGRKISDARYLAAWDRITGLMLAVDPSFKFIWNVLADPFNDTATYGRMPNGNVSLVSIDLYWYPEFTDADAKRAFASYSRGAVGLTEIQHMATVLGVPWAIDECGCHKDSGMFVRLLADYLKTQDSQPEWLCWWDDNSGFASRISDGLSGSTGEAFVDRFAPKKPDERDDRIKELEAQVTALTLERDQARADTQRIAERAQDVEKTLTDIRLLWGQLNRGLGPQ